jgi:hypothetical protein
MRKLLCTIFGHKYFPFARAVDDLHSPNTIWLKCHRCKGDFVVADYLTEICPLGEIQYMHKWRTIEQ